MNNYLSSFSLLQHNASLINELKYKVHKNPKKYALKTAQEVESIFIQILIKNMRNTLQKDSLLDNDQSRLYTDVYDQKISDEIAKKGIGLTKIILKQIENSK